MSLNLFCSFGDYPYSGDLSLRCRRYLISALHSQASAETMQAVQSALATQQAQAVQSASCHSTRLCIASSLRPPMNVLVPSGTGVPCDSAGSSVSLIKESIMVFSL